MAPAHGVRARDGPNVQEKNSTPARSDRVLKAGNHTHPSSGAIGMRCASVGAEAVVSAGNVATAGSPSTTVGAPKASSTRARSGRPKRKDKRERKHPEKHRRRSHRIMRNRINASSAKAAVAEGAAVAIVPSSAQKRRRSISLLPPRRLSPHIWKARTSSNRMQTRSRGLSGHCQSRLKLLPQAELKMR